MCSIAYAVDGTLLSGPKGDFESDPHFQRIHADDGRPSHFEQRALPTTTALTEVKPNELNKANGAVKAVAGGMDRKSVTGPCPHCGKSTHPESRCFDKYPHLAPKWLQDRMASSVLTAKPTVTDGTAIAENLAV